MTQLLDARYKSGMSGQSIVVGGVRPSARPTASGTLILNIDDAIPAELSERIILLREVLAVVTDKWYVYCIRQCTEGQCSEILSLIISCCSAVMVAHLV